MMKKHMHDWIREKIDTTPGLTQKGLAESMGVNPAAVNRMLYGRRKIMVEEVPVIESYLGARYEMTQSNAMQYRQNQMASGQGGGFSDVTTGQVLPLPNTGGKIPVYGYSGQTGGQGLNLSERTAVDWVDGHPLQDRIEGAFAIYMSSENMSPRYYLGELIYIHPGRPPSEGRDCLVEMQNGDAAVMRFVSQTQTHVKLSQLNPAQSVSLKFENIKKIYAIVGRG